MMAPSTLCLAIAAVVGSSQACTAGPEFAVAGSTTANALYEIAAFDFDADGDLDLVASSVLDGNDTPRLTVLWNDGRGVLTTQQIDVETVIAEVDAGDIDGDGLGDIAIVPQSSDGVVGGPPEIYMQTSLGVFERLPVVHPRVSRSDILLRDLNGDSLPDLLASTPDSSLVFENMDGGEFSAPRVLSEESREIVAFLPFDRDDDGDDDFVTVSESGSIRLLENRGAFEFVEVLGTTDGSHGFHNNSDSALINAHTPGDPSLLAIGPWVDTVGLFAPTQDGYSLSESIAVTTGAFGPTIRSADLDNDGDTDAVALGDSMTILENREGVLEPTELPRETVRGQVVPALALADLNGDGLPEIIGGQSRIGPYAPLLIQFNTTGTTPCGLADIALPYGTLDLADLTMLVASFNAEFTLADVNGDRIMDLADIVAFVQAFAAGCP
jgi:hypothetical protein